MSNNSASGGYVLPTSTTPIPGGLTLNQFLQTMFVGISGFDGTLVRREWQQKPPKQPAIDVNWMAFGIVDFNSDTFAYSGLGTDDVFELKRNQEMEVHIKVYGPDALENANLIMDGLQIQQNLEALQLANMGLINTGPALHVPEIVNEVWFDRYDFSVFIRRQIQRVYPMLTFLNAAGTFTTILGSEDYLADWSTETEEN